MENKNYIRTLGDYSRPSHEGYRNTIEFPDGNNVVPLRFDTIRLVQNGCSFHGLQSEDPNQHLKDFLKLVASLDLDVANKDLTLYDNESWNDPRDFAKPVKAISLPQDVPSTSDHRFIELENQVQRLMEAHLAPKSYVQVNKIASSCEICSGPHDTQYCMEILSKLLLIMHPRVTTKWEESKERGIIEPNATKNNNNNTSVEMEEKLGEELSGSEIVIGECESRDIKWDNLDYKICEDTKEVEEAEEESEESEEEVEEKLKEEEKEEED
ncbi:hypothetical protein Tco_1001533, partial [Tanacetum coccineum]